MAGRIAGREEDRLLVSQGADRALANCRYSDHRWKSGEGLRCSPDRRDTNPDPLDARWKKYQFRSDTRWNLEYLATAARRQPSPPGDQLRLRPDLLVRLVARWKTRHIPRESDRRRPPFQ